MDAKNYDALKKLNTLKKQKFNFVVTIRFILQH